jgi:hypothetical protein
MNISLNTIILNEQIISEKSSHTENNNKENIQDTDNHHEPKEVFSNHDLILKERQIIGQDRINVAMEMILNHNGSSKSYRDSRINDGLPVASVDVYTKIMQEYSNRESISTDWYNNLLTHATTLNATVDGKKINGFVQYVSNYPSLFIVSYMEKQLDCVRVTDYHKRFLHIDATGNIVCIGKKFTKHQHRDHNRILTYYNLMKNSDFLDQTNGSVLVGELTSDAHDVITINNYLNILKQGYEKINRYDTYNFRLITVDMSWALNHSIVNVFNKMDIDKYGDKVFELASGNTGLLEDTSCSWIVSCAGHTMKRFTNMLGKQKLKKSNYLYACYCFSLLLNSTTLAMISNIFELMCIIMCSEYMSKNVDMAEEKLKKLLEERPKTDTEFNNLMDEIEKKFNLAEKQGKNHEIDQSDENEDYDYFIMTDEQRDEYVYKKKETIKSRSKFTLIFRNIYDKVIDSLENEANDSIINNTKYAPQVIIKLLENFMPYCFIWASFVLFGLLITRYTNGIVEIYNRFIKYSTTPKLLPHKYSLQQFKRVGGSCIQYLNDIKTGTKKHKQPKAINTSAFDQKKEKSVYEESKTKASERWNKKQKINNFNYQHKVNIGNKD